MTRATVTNLWGEDVEPPAPVRAPDGRFSPRTSPPPPPVPVASQDPEYGQRFDGSDYVPVIDDRRLTGQLKRIYDLMSDGDWRTTFEIHDATGDPQASILAQLGHLRKARFGAYLVEKRKRGAGDGTWEYRVGGKGEGIPQSKSCVRCRVLEAEVADLRRRLGP